MVWFSFEDRTGDLAGGNRRELYVDLERGVWILSFGVLWIEPETSSCEICVVFTWIGLNFGRRYE